MTKENINKYETMIYQVLWWLPEWSGTNRAGRQINLKQCVCVCGQSNINYKEENIIGQAKYTNDK